MGRPVSLLSLIIHSPHILIYIIIPANIIYLSTMNRSFIYLSYYRVISHAMKAGPTAPAASAGATASSTAASTTSSTPSAGAKPEAPTETLEDIEKEETNYLKQYEDYKNQFETWR